MQYNSVGYMSFPFGLLSAPLTYDAPTLGEMRENVRRDLQDEDAKTFTDEITDDCIRAAFAEVSQVYPKEMLDSVVMVAGMYEYMVYALNPYRVEIIKGGTTPILTLERTSSEDANDGWDYFGGVLHLPHNTRFVAGSDVLRIRGYGERFMPTQTDDYCDLDQSSDKGVRDYAHFAGYRRLIAERALFTQWNTLPGNSDVTLAQLNAMAGAANDAWNDWRKRLMLLHRAA